MPFDIQWVRERLPGRRIEWFTSVDSTMAVAARFAREGCPSGTIVGADEQSAGIGRHGHSWHSEAGAGLYVSFVLKASAADSALPLMMLVLGLATRDAISRTSGLAPDLRWPNDVLLDERKCAGILAQMEGDAIVAGIGINVSHREFPEEIREVATSLALASPPSGVCVTREDLLVALARAIDEHCEILATQGPSAILNKFTRASSYAAGRRVRVDQSGAVVEGVTCGLDPSGFLLVRQDNGVETTILAGGVRPA
ncbi:MAG TPA: biotin--[acetyl-CoA-carboxylase] ligase [Bryobacteraceae bacterium]|nr:biotin--[acetyl-CoA-carboxylase] ligase [Bryobacteraceae bacterium]